MAAVVAVATAVPPFLAPVAVLTVFFFVVTGSNPCNSTSSNQAKFRSCQTKLFIRAVESSKGFSNYHLFLIG
jgi:hypothetical protein